MSQLEEEGLTATKGGAVQPASGTAAATLNANDMIGVNG